MTEPLLLTIEKQRAENECQNESTMGFKRLELHVSEAEYEMKQNVLQMTIKNRKRKGREKLLIIMSHWVAEKNKRRLLQMFILFSRKYK